MKYPKLFSRGKIGNLELKNRIVMPPMGTGFASENGEASDEIIRYYEERARGGCGLIITEITRIDNETGVGTARQLNATAGKYITRLGYLADAVHRHDTKIFLQLHHPGRETPSSLLGGKQIVAPSAIPCGVIREMPRALTTEECEAMVKKFITGAVIAQKAGIDGVELHAAHGYLINQFLSPYTNKRTDKYGGDFVNRMRFLTEIVVGIRFACGPNFPICVRISADEYIEGGLKLEDSVKIARTLESLGVAAINVSCGTYESGATVIEPYYTPEGWKQHLGKAIKENVKIPVIAVNALKRPAKAEEMLDNGVCDFVGMGRGLLADPEWGNKSKAGDETLMRKCLGCMYCFLKANSGGQIACTINPRLGRETVYNENTICKNGDGRNVAVIGGGPAGMQAAYVLGQRGFKVTLFDKGDKLGGTINVADKPPMKSLLTEFVQTQTNELKSVGVDVKLNTEATVDKVKALNPYGVIVAVGGSPIVPGVPGADGKNVCLAEDVLAGKVDIKGKKVVIIGGGVTGLETAEFLSEGNNQITVVEMAPDVGTTLYASVKGGLLRRLSQAKVEILTSRTVSAINDKEVTILNTNAFASTIPADVVILAVGVRSNKAVVEEFLTAFDKITTVGDASKPGLIGDAIKEANDKAFVF